MPIDKWNANEGTNVGLGQVGSIFEDGTTDHNNVNVVAVQFVTDCTFTKLEPKSVEFMGTSTGSVTPNGDAIDNGNTFPTGMVIFGHWDRFQLATGTAIAYLGGYNT
tara:strand:+ start:130 stop:450 length:321 start_codon:yes stop_codon:yes gene_type:complete